MARADLNGATLEGARLHGARLRLANLSSAKMSGADLSFADLTRANLSGVDLSRADLSNAGLTHVNLSYANLSGTNVSNAYLNGANFAETTLIGTDVTMASLGGARFTACDLRDAIGLESIRHSGPSTIGIDTLYATDGNIPDIFLRGCGVPEDFIAYKLSFVGSALDFYSCFISYSHEDKQFARRLHDALQGKGIRCWLDEHQLNPGDNIYKDVDRGIRVWDKVLLCCSGESLTSWWVGREIETAIEREQQFHKEHGTEILKIIPLNLDGSLFDWKGEHAATIRKRLAADFTGWNSDADKFDSQLEQVVKALRTDGGKPPEPKPKLGQ